MNDQVILVDDRDNQIGTAIKAQIHTDKTPLHRAFSIFIFNNRGEVLVQQRAVHKITWPGIWSNSCCGHVAPGETYEAAVRRRVKQELGIKIHDLRKVSDYRYRFEYKGIVENEICPVYRGVVAGEVKPDLSEVVDWKWVNWGEWIKILDKDRPGELGIWSEWCKEEVKLITA